MRFFRKKTDQNIATKVTTLLFWFGITPLFVLTLLFFFFYYNSQKQALLQLQNEIALKIAADISGRLDKTVARVELMGKYIYPGLNNKNRLEEIVDLLFEEELAFEVISITDADYNEKLKISRYYTFRPFELSSIGHLGIVKRAGEGRTVINPNVKISPFSQFPQLEIVVPITSRNNKISGVILASVNIAKMWELIAPHRIGESRNAYIVDANGLLIAYRDTSSVLQKKDLRHIKGIADFVNNRVGTFQSRGIEQTAVIGAMARIHLTGWGVVVEQPKFAAYRNLYLFSFLIVTAAFIAMLFAIISGLKFSSKSIVRPIRRLQEETSILAKGHSDINIEVDSTDELGQLATSFNLMVKNLKKTTVSRDRLIQEMAGRKAVDRALRQERDRFQKYLDIAGVIILVLDQDGIVTLINKKGLEISGYGLADIIGQNWFDITLPKEKGPDVFSDFKKLTDGRMDGMGKYESEMVAKNGDRRVIAWNNICLKDENGKTIGTLSSGEDVTKAKEMERQLRQSHKMEAIGTIAGGIAHDFNNILGIIIGNAEVAIDDVPAWNPASQNLQEIKFAGLRAKNVVKQLLRFSRKTEQETKRINIATAIEESVKFLRASIPASIEIQTALADLKGSIQVDPTQFHQVMMNLCINGYHAMEETGGVLKITTKSVRFNAKTPDIVPGLDPGPYVKISVMDSGLGIESGIIERIFDPYFTTKEVGKGSGMGLAVVHGIVINHNGAVTVESDVGKGTAFHVYFPLVDKPPEVEPDIDTAPELYFGNETILFLDDETAIVNIAKQMLGQMGYRVEAFTSPTEALARFQSKPDQFDLVITDMTMPHMSGVVFSEEIAAIDRDIPIIICSGHHAMINEKKVRAMGITAAYVKKPMEKSKIGKVIRDVLDEKK